MGEVIKKQTTGFYLLSDSNVFNANTNTGTYNINIIKNILYTDNTNYQYYFFLNATGLGTDTGIITLGLVYPATSGSNYIVCSWDADVQNNNYLYGSVQSASIVINYHCHVSFNAAFTVICQ